MKPLEELTIFRTLLCSRGMLYMAPPSSTHFYLFFSTHAGANPCSDRNVANYCVNFVAMNPTDDIIKECEICSNQAGFDAVMPMHNRFNP